MAKSVNDRLWDAVEKGDWDAVARALKKGADENYCRKGNGLVYGAVISRAAMLGHTLVVRVLLARGADIHIHNEEALSAAVDGYQTEMVALLLAFGAKADANKNYAMACAARRGDADMIRLLVEHGVDIKYAYFNSKNPAVMEVIKEYKSENKVAVPPEPKKRPRARVKKEEVAPDTTHEERLASLKEFKKRTERFKRPENFGRTSEMGR